MTCTFPKTICRRSELAAFTLIELLTVIVIIGVLAAIILPVTSRVRQSARDTQCTARIRQWAFATQLYVIDSKGIFPNTAGSFAHQALIPYLNTKIEGANYGERRIYFLACPAPLEKNGKDTYWMYGFNESISQQPASLITQPSRLILAGCSSSQWVNKTRWATTPKPHRGKVNIVHLDASARLAKVSTLMKADLSRETPSYSASDENSPLGDPANDK
ncbi:type II secretion system protein [Opitutaceae bacterium TAV4]|nr:type II secretion system protein [Opitutaceae bacterium TAV4]RRJ98758.1 type II secretion system protein [Opitutaceae bacterium TAV3]